MVVLGIDPGTATTGYGLIRVLKKDLMPLKFGLIETNKNHDPAVRLQSIYRQMDVVLGTYRPDALAIEKVFFAANAKTAIRVGQAQGVILLSAAAYKIPVMEYAPGTIKKIVSGNGRSDKKQMQQALRKIFGFGIRSKVKKKTHFDNEADALAVALCHIVKSKEIDTDWLDIESMLS